MEANQRIIELRAMFLELSEIILEEMKAGKDVQSSETFNTLKQVQAELEQLEEERLKGLN
jgi:hypothetical protein